MTGFGGRTRGMLARDTRKVAVIERSGSEFFG
jgi:hypothetical protein